MEGSVVGVIKRVLGLSTIAHMSHEWAHYLPHLAAWEADNSSSSLPDLS